MFGNVVYLDYHKLNEYKSIATGKKNIKIDNYEVENDKGASINLPVIGAEAKSNKSYTAIIEESLLYDCNDFENILYGRDDFLDFTISGDYEITAAQRGQIVKLDALIYIPKEFDMTQIIHQYKSWFIREVPEMRDFINESVPKVPLLIEFNNISLCAKIDSQYLKVKYVDLEEYENIDVTILAKVMSNRLVSKSKPIYDPLKDYISFNRETRRKFMGERPEELSEIYHDEDYMSIEIIAIYQ